MAPFTAEPTPNPNSLKFTARDTPFIESGLRAYSSRREAADDPLASALFEIAGVADVLILPTFLTITKTAESDWNHIVPRIEGILQSRFG